jgi:hypothetical protein
VISEKLAASSLKAILGDIRASAKKGALTSEFCKELDEAYRLRIAELVTDKDAKPDEWLALMDHFSRITHESTFAAINGAVVGLGYAWRNYAKLIATVLNTKRMDEFYAERAFEDQKEEGVRHFRPSWVNLGKIVLSEEHGIKWTAAFDSFLKQDIAPKTRGGFSQLVNRMSAAEWLKVRRNDHGVFLFRGRLLPDLFRSEPKEEPVSMRVTEVQLDAGLSELPDIPNSWEYDVAMKAEPVPVQAPARYGYVVENEVSGGYHWRSEGGSMHRAAAFHVSERNNSEMASSPETFSHRLTLRKR